MTPPLFRLSHASFSYQQGRPALADTTLTIAPQERVACLGANGSGKSTLLKLMAGLLVAQEGEVEFLGRRLTDETLRASDFNRRFRRNVGIVFQNSDAQLFCPTVQEEVAFGPLHLGMPPEQATQRVNELLQLMQIEQLRDRLPEQLSEGEKKRVAIAAVLASNPDVVLLDEPTTALDPRSRWGLVDIILGLQGAGKTVVTATNDLEIVPAIADRLCILNETHRVLADGPTEPLLGRKEILEQANLIHVHAHAHQGAAHRHPHRHPDALRDHHGEPEAP